MLEFIRTCGPVGWPLVAPTVLVVTFSIRIAIQLRRAAPLPSPSLANRMTAPLVWVGIAAVLGFLGRCAGIYIALNVIARAEDISPGIVWAGFAVSFSPTLFGLAILLISSLAWLALQAVCGRRLRAARGR